VLVRLDAASPGRQEITLSALGATATGTVMVGAANVRLTPAVSTDANGEQVLAAVPIGSCAAIGGTVASPATGSVTLAASRGVLFRDADCTTALSGTLALSGGVLARSYIRSANAGISTIEATVSGAASGSTRIEFVAPLLSSSTVNLQADLQLVGSGERSTLIAVVRDGTPANNLVKGATVQFSILADPSGGALLEPFTAVTGSDGIARAVFVAGPADGAKDGTLIAARIAGMSASATTALTVNKKALSIQFGTGNQLTALSPATLQKDFAVFVSDSAGNPVKDVNISAAVWPTSYSKGLMNWEALDGSTTEGRWIRSVAATCVNEDTQRKGLFDSAFDTNGNGVLDPGIPLSVSSGGKTDALGLSTVSLRYPRDRAYWVRVELTVGGIVAGTESVARSTLWLTGLAADYTDRKVSPPGSLSPYGQDASCSSAD
jgi:hypothetical protein